MRAKCAALIICWLPVAVLAGASSAACAQDAPQWTVKEVSGDSPGETYTELSLAGTYVQRPGESTAEPSLVIDCAKGKVLWNYFSFGAVLSEHVGGLHRVELEAYDDEVRRSIIVDELSPDATSAYFSRIELKRMLYSKSVRVRAVELGGPPFVSVFTMPDAAPVFAACGKDLILKQR